MKRKRDNWTETSLKILMIPILLVGIFLFLNGLIMPFLSERLTKEHLLSNYSAEELAKNQKKSSEYDYEGVSYLTSLSLLQSQAKDMVEKDRVPVVGDIVIPSVNIHLPIVKGISQYYLSIGAGEMRPEEKMGVHNYSLASHNFNDDRILFSPLRHINIGDKVYLSDKRNVYVYEVDDKEYVAPTQISVIEEGKENKITLVTCSMSGKTRLVVTGPLVKTYSWAKTPGNVKDYFLGGRNDR